MPVRSTFIFAASIGLAAFGARPPIAAAQSPVEKIAEFDMAQVTVTDPYLMQLFSVDVDYLLGLDPDRLLAGFRAVSLNQDPGTASGVNVYDGWEGAWSLLRGHTLGHYLTALAQAHKQTDGTDAPMHAEIENVLNYMISELKTYQDRRANGYLFASPESHFDVVEGRISGDMWVPWYTMHKIIAGLLDVYKLAGNPTALQIASKLGDWTFTRSSAWDSAMRTRVLGVEYGGMNDCLYELYKQTQSPNHLTAAHRFDEETLFTPISQGTDVLNGKHANTQIPKLIGALNRYRTLGAAEEFYHTTAKQFWEIVVGEHTYITGGNSENEHFHEAGKLDERRNNINNETCNTYNMLKLTRELFKISGDVKYADFYERALINEILSAINPETGMTTYFKPMGTGYFKLFGEETSTFWCCNGTGMENYTKLDDGIYYHEDETLFINLYLSSSLTWEEKSFRLTQTAELPLNPTVIFAVSEAPAEELTLRFRRPYWLAKGEQAVLRVNGEALCLDSSDGYFAVSRVWNEGDQIELTLPADVQVSRLPDNQNAVAFTYGPVVLSAGMGTQQMVSEGHLASAKATIPAGVTIKDTIAIDSGTTIEDWLADIREHLVQTPGMLEFRLEGTDSDESLIFTPQYLRYKDRYGIYFQVQGTQGTPPLAPPPASTETRCDLPNTGTGGAASMSGGAASMGGIDGGGMSSLGGSNLGGGSSAAGGGVASSMGGTLATGGIESAGGPAGGSATGGAAGPVEPGVDAGCGCRTARSNSNSSLWLGLGVMGFLLARRRGGRPVARLN